MTQIFMNEVDRVKKHILAVSAMVEENVVLAVKALKDRDETLAREVELSDEKIDAAEVEVEEEALKILALHQPVAMDLRFITCVLKINNDLERIGDLAANIAKRARKMCKDPALPIPQELHQMASYARDMVRDSLTAFVNLDVDLATTVHTRDDLVDSLCRDVRRFIEQKIKEKPDHIRYYLHMLSAARNLERIGDHATNITEDVIYLIEGQIVRHKSLDDE